MSHAPWTRREWLARNAAAAAAAAIVPGAARHRRGTLADTSAAARLAVRGERLDPSAAEGIVQRALDAATAAGATYADARVMRTMVHYYQFGWDGGLYADVHTLGIGVRALVNGYWGFAGSTLADADEAARLGREAVSVARANAKGPPLATDLGHYPVAHGHWAMPVRIDPFTVPIEEKADAMLDWSSWAERSGCALDNVRSWLQFARQERVTGTSDGSLYTQTLYESGGRIGVGLSNGGTNTLLPIQGIEVTGRGWELFIDANIPEQMRGMAAMLKAKTALDQGARPVTIGQYTLVCDGATMAAVAERTLGMATQLDRALGYEANASGTSYIDDPLGMLGQAKVASPFVTLTADRSMEGGLATVRWDDEGVEPDTATLVQDGVLTDFQTTRESAGWLKAYYQKAGKPVRSHGFAAVENGLGVPLQQMPNLAVAPGAAAVRLDDLIGAVTRGILVTNGDVRADFQAKNGMLSGGMREIRNGRLGPPLSGGAVLFNSADLWQRVTTVGGPTTQMTLGASQYVYSLGVFQPYGFEWRQKGQPPQMTGHSVRAPAAVITNQALIDPSRKA